MSLPELLQEPGRSVLIHEALGGRDIACFIPPLVFMHVL